MPRVASQLNSLNEQITTGRENIRELVEQAAAYSATADDDLMSRRLAEQETRLEFLIKRNELSRQASLRRAERAKGAGRSVEDTKVIGANAVALGETTPLSLQRRITIDVDPISFPRRHVTGFAVQSVVGRCRL